MHDLSHASIKKIVVHWVGNRSHEEPLRLSQHHLRLLAVEEEEMLLRYFLHPFKQEEYHAFHHHTDLELNESYSFVNDLFLTSINFLEASNRLAKHLHAHSIHPNIKGGEFYVVHFDGVILDGMEVEALGVFKSERKSTFLQVTSQEDQADLLFEQGIDIQKLDKGCLVFKTDGESGYKVLIHDAVSKGDEAVYWKEDFLGVIPITTEFTQTRDYMEMTRSFVMDEMPQAFDIDRTQQIQMLNRSSGYFTESKEIDTQEFAREVLSEPEVIDTFNAYKERYEQEKDIQIEDHFERSPAAVKQGKKFFKSVLKLDKNFHIYVHGNPNNIEQGYDAERGMKFYKVFFNEER